MLSCAAFEVFPVQPEEPPTVFTFKSQRLRDPLYNIADGSNVRPAVRFN